MNWRGDFVLPILFIFKVSSHSPFSSGARVAGGAAQTSRRTSGAEVRGETLESVGRTLGAKGGYL